MYISGVLLDVLHIAKRLSDLDFLTSFDRPFETTLDLGFTDTRLICRRCLMTSRSLKHNDNTRPQLEPTHLLSSAQSMPTQHFARIVVSSLTEPRIWLPPLHRPGRLPIRLGIRRQRIRPQLPIEVDDDRAHIRRPDRRIAEKPMFPPTQQHHAFIQREQARECPLHVRRYRVEFAGEVAAFAAYPAHGRVEAVVVAGREVDDDVVEFGGAGGLAEGRPPWLLGLGCG